MPLDMNALALFFHVHGLVGENNLDNLESCNISSTHLLLLSFYYFNYVNICVCVCVLNF